MVNMIDVVKQALARGYCHEVNKAKIVDPDLITAMAFEVVAVLDNKEDCVAHCDKKEDADRIAICLDACAGISNEALDAGIIGEMKEVMIDLCRAVNSKKDIEGINAIVRSNEVLAKLK